VVIEGAAGWFVSRSRSSRLRALRIGTVISSCASPRRVIVVGGVVAVGLLVGGVATVAIVVVVVVAGVAGVARLVGSDTAIHDGVGSGAFMPRGAGVVCTGDGDGTGCGNADTLPRSSCGCVDGALVDDGCATSCCNAANKAAEPAATAAVRASTAVGGPLVFAWCAGDAIDDGGAWGAVRVVCVVDVGAGVAAATPRTTNGAETIDTIDTVGTVDVVGCSVFSRWTGDSPVGSSMVVNGVVVIDSVGGGVAPGVAGRVTAA
jgi:hypothetical protein